MSSTLFTDSNLPGNTPLRYLRSMPLPSLTSTYSKIMASNATWFLNPSPKDLVLAIPRMVTQAGSLALNNIPGLDALLRGGSNGSVIAEATGHTVESTASVALPDISSIQQTAAAFAATTAEARQSETGFFSQPFTFQQLRSLGGIFTYLTSKWALTCFLLVSLET